MNDLTKNTFTQTTTDLSGLNDRQREAVIS